MKYLLILRKAMLNLEVKSVRNSLKVAKWEIKRNLSNKSFIISLLITPIIFMFFLIVPSLFGGSDSDEQVTVYVLDELNVWNEIEQVVSKQGLDHWDLQLTTESEEAMRTQLGDSEQTIFIPLTEASVEQGLVHVYMSEDIDESFMFEASALEIPLRSIQMERMGLTEEQQMMITQGIVLEPVIEEEVTAEAGADPLERIVPGIFAGIILFSIVMTGMMIFTSASQEKKEKVAEIILSSISPGELMQGKILGYFVLGLTQVIVWIGLALPVVIWKFDLPLLKYIFVPELLLLLFIAFAGYLLFAAIFVAIGATVEDMTATSNFQGIVMMLPFLPFIIASPIFSDPEGLVAKIGTFFPITAPGVLLIRLSIMEQWPWVEIVIALIVLIISIWIIMKLAGKIFKVGILMYGKNATPKEIWKWMWM